MNEQGSMMNQQQMMNMNQQQMMNMNPHPLPQIQQVMNQNYNPNRLYSTNMCMNIPHIMNLSSGVSQKFRSHSQMQQPPPLPQMMNRSYGMWPPPPSVDLMKFQNPKPQGFVSGGKQSKPLGPRNNWKGKKMNKNDMRMDGGRRKEKALMIGNSGGVATGVIGGGASMAATGSNVGGGPGGYKPPTLNDLQRQNRIRARRFFPNKKKFHHNNNNMNAPFAPRNTTSFIIRAKKSGGIASLVSPCPVTPAVLPTPIFSPSREVLVDMAKEEWGVDGYGSMKGLIRLRSPGQEADAHEDEDEDDGGSSESDVEEHVEVERRLDHDLSRFEMIYPNYSGIEYSNVLGNRVDDQDNHIAQLEEENLILKDRLFLMERELGDLRRRLQSLERQSHGREEINEEVVENESENESESHGEGHSVEDNNVELVGEDMERVGDVKGKQESMSDDDVDSAQKEEKVGKHCEEVSGDTIYEAGKKEVITDVRSKCKTYGDVDVRTGNEFQVAKIIENNDNHTEASDNASVEDATMEEASKHTAEVVAQTMVEDEGLGNE